MLVATAADDKTLQQLNRLLRLTEAIRHNQETVAEILKDLSNIEWLLTHGGTRDIIDSLASCVLEAYEELSQDDQIALYMAPSKGGIWETWQREVIKTGEIGPAWDAYRRRM